MFGFWSKQGGNTEKELQAQAKCDKMSLYRKPPISNHTVIWLGQFDHDSIIYAPKKIWFFNTCPTLSEC